MATIDESAATLARTILDEAGARVKQLEVASSSLAAEFDALAAEVKDGNFSCTARLGVIAATNRRAINNRFPLTIDAQILPGTLADMEVEFQKALDAIKEDLRKDKGLGRKTTESESSIITDAGG